MTKENGNKWTKEITHWLNGGLLIEYYEKQWLNVPQKKHDFEGSLYIINDKHVEARKAFTFGKEIEVSYTKDMWEDTAEPSWDVSAVYRVKTKIIYEWQWYKVLFDKVFQLTTEHYVEYDIGWVKFEPSKRIRK